MEGKKILKNKIIDHINNGDTKCHVDLFIQKGSDDEPVFYKQVEALHDLNITVTSERAAEAFITLINSD